MPASGRALTGLSVMPSSVPLRKPSSLLMQDDVKKKLKGKPRLLVKLSLSVSRKRIKQLKIENMKKRLGSKNTSSNNKRNFPTMHSEVVSTYGPLLKENMNTGALT